MLRHQAVKKDLCHVRSRTASRREHLLDVEAQLRWQGMDWRLQRALWPLHRLSGRALGREPEDPALNLVLSVKACTYWVGCCVPLCQVLGGQSQMWQPWTLPSWGIHPLPAWHWAASSHLSLSVPVSKTRRLGDDVQHSCLLRTP